MSDDIDRAHPGFVAAVDQLVADVTHKVRENGVEVIGVFPTETGELDLPFSYTVGLTAASCPELVLVGPQLEQSHPVLTVLARMVLDGERPAYDPLGERLVDPFGTGFDLATIVNVDALDDWAACRYPPSLARRVYGPDVPFLQVVWQDDEGRWPWDEGALKLPLLGPVPKWARS